MLGFKNLLQMLRRPLKVKRGLKKSIKTESVKTSKSVSGTNSDDLPERSETGVFVDGNISFAFFYSCT